MLHLPGEGRNYPTYRSYLVRFWQSAPQGDWRVSAQCVQGGNTILFGDMARLLVFLQNEINTQPTPNQHQSPAEAEGHKASS